MVNLFHGKNDDTRKRNEAIALKQFGDDPRWQINARSQALNEAEDDWHRAQRAYDSLVEDLECLKLLAAVLTALVAHSPVPTSIAA